ncbi:LysR family transcriptional regulator [Sessilibacter corallicola]|uniref:LysR family transcriptional regulator n=1 Tax=Sessilibacter corallicola TaxID=2904075 RepID=A0ABQ0A8Z9_9GAMM|nr:LysR family transcriptional regulator [Sessilibacter corallicola]MCE2030158.1 LysR family transcriptional regulator [Sessilibacter corallicola]
MLDVSDINLIKTVSETGSVNKAADKLFMSQPTLSKRISRLEQVLKIELFHRYSGGMIPTEAANYLIGNGQFIQSKLDSMRRHVQRLSELEEGTLNIGVGPITEQVYFPKVLLDFIKQTSNIKVSLSTESSERLLSMVDDGSVDVGIGPFQVSDLPEGFLFYGLKSADIIFLARPEHPVFDQDKTYSLEEILAYNSITPKVSQSILEAANTPALQNFPLITCNNYGIAKAMAVKSDYITAGPEILFTEELEKNNLKKIPIDVSIPWSSFCVLREEAIHTPAVNKFIEIMKAF